MQINSTTRDSNQKWNNDKCQCECKKDRMCQKDYSWNLTTCIHDNGKYLKSINDFSVILYDEIVNASVSTNMTNIIPTNVMSAISKNVLSTLSVNSDDKK